MEKEEFIKKYQSMTNKDLASELNVTEVTVVRYAKLFEVAKGPGNYKRISCVNK